MDIDGPSRTFHTWAAYAASFGNPDKQDAIINEIKVISLDLCTLVLTVAAVTSLVRGRLPLSLASIVFNGAALLGRIIIERSMHPKVYERPIDFLSGLIHKKNIPIPFDMKGWGLFYLSPWMKGKIHF